MWDNNHGANTACISMGYTSGVNPRYANPPGDFQDGSMTDYVDMYRPGKCNAGEPINACTAGGNNLNAGPASSSPAFIITCW